MFDLKKWQESYENELKNNPEKYSVYTKHVRPVMNHLVPELEKLQQESLQTIQTETRKANDGGEIVCTASTLQEMRGSFFSILNDEFWQLYINIDDRTADSRKKLLRILQDPFDHQLSTSIWLRAGICYGDEDLLKKQRIDVTLSNGDEVVTVPGRYVPYQGALEVMDLLLERAKLVNVSIPFVPDFYAARFYLLVIEVNDDRFQEWNEIKSVDIAQLGNDLEEQIQFHPNEYPVWNVQVVSIQPQRGKTHLVPNGYFRREYRHDSKKWLPSVEDDSRFVSYSYHDEGGLSVVVELPEDRTTIEAYVIHDVPESVDQILSNACEASYHLSQLSQQPSMADFEYVLEMYPYFQSLQLIDLRLEVVAPKAGQLFRRDCIVVDVQSDDEMAESKKRALRQAILSIWPYADCKVR